MARPQDGTSLGWDALAPGSGRDALTVTTTDALSATSADTVAVEYGPDALAVGYGADTPAHGYGGDALAVRYGAATPAVGDPLAAPVLGDTVGDSLTAYGDATAAGRPDSRRTAGRPTPRPGPVAPGSAPTDEVARERGAGRAAMTGQAAAGRAASAARSRPARGRQPSPVPRPRPSGSTSASRRSGQPGAGGPRAASSSGQPGAGSTPRPTGAGAATRRQGPTWEELLRIGAQGQPGGGRAPAHGERYGGPPHDVPGPRGHGPVRTSPPRLDRISRPTGTVPWAGRSGWDDFLAGTAGAGKQPSGADVARALLKAFRRSLRDR
jgi:hypothetical protein